MEGPDLTSTEDIHLLGCGCHIITPRPDLLAGGKRLAETWIHPGCTLHNAAGNTGPTYQLEPDADD